MLTLFGLIFKLIAFGTLNILVMSMLKDLSNAGMAMWDGFGRVLHIASYCIILHGILHGTTIYNSYNVSTIKIIQLFQLRKFYDNCLIVRLVFALHSIVEDSTYYNHYHFQRLDKFLHEVTSSQFKTECIL